ncbi:hypothetical protein J6590_070648 [Homalodisca vitripennis]|nr:hypothetical protein J6590_070648 [Homalodisca vitripennis]
MVKCSSGPHPVTTCSLTLDCKGPEIDSAGVSLLNHPVDSSPSASPLLSQLYNRKSFSDSASQTEDGHMKTKDGLIVASVFEPCLEQCSQYDGKLHKRRYSGSNSIAEANDLSDIRPRVNRPARLIVDQVKSETNHHGSQESLEEVGAAMVDVIRFRRRLFALHGQHLNVFGKRVFCGMIAASAKRLRLSTIRRPTSVLDMQVLPEVSDYAPSPTALTSNLRKDDAHQLSSSPISLQLVSYADAVKSPLRIVSRSSTEESARCREVDVAETVDAPPNKYVVTSVYE